MFSSIAITLLTSIVAQAALPGIDVSSWQGNVDWAGVASRGNKFAYIKATEGGSTY